MMLGVFTSTIRNAILEAEELHSLNSSYPKLNVRIAGFDYKQYGGQYKAYNQLNWTSGLPYEHFGDEKYKYTQLLREYVPK